MRFENRRQAGRELAHALAFYRRFEPIVLALPRGGVVVGDEVARALAAPLDVLIVRKLGVPWHPELGFGAVAEGGVVVVDRQVCRWIGVTHADIEAAIAQQRGEVEQRVLRLRGRAKPLELRDRTVILVDDGIATGGTARAAIQAVRAQRPSRIVFAVPVAAAETARDLAGQLDEFVCLEAPWHLGAVGAFYVDFTQVTDDAVVAILDQAATRFAAAHELQEGRHEVP